jgi:RimJ/RimL family protein N-acetyltransferase
MTNPEEPLPRSDASADTILIDAPDLLLDCSLTGWDTRALGFPAATIHRLRLRNVVGAPSYADFERARDVQHLGFITCRLPHNLVRESQFLEDKGFRFIEMVLFPELGTPARLPIDFNPLDVAPATDSDLPPLRNAAAGAFSIQRFQMDPRLDPAAGASRYANWVENALRHPRQELVTLREGQRLVAFFVTERLPDQSTYWHLNAVLPEAQGEGLGERAWLTMIQNAQDSGAVRIRTCITARNHRVLNLYARLGFRFSPPAMTFHWVRPQRAYR